MVSFFVEALTASVISVLVERILRKAFSNNKNNNVNNINYQPQTTQDEIVIVTESNSNNKLFILKLYIIMSDDIPIIKPIKLKEYEVKQSKYNIASKLPIRSIILGPSGSGKSIITKYDIRYL